MESKDGCASMGMHLMLQKGEFYAIIFYPNRKCFIFHKCRGSIQMITGSELMEFQLRFACNMCGEHMCFCVSALDLGCRSVSTSPAVLPAVAWGLEDVQAGGF